MSTHIVLTRKISDERITIVVPIHSAIFTEDMEGRVMLRSADLTVHIEQSMQDIIEMIKPIGFYNK